MLASCAVLVIRTPNEASRRVGLAKDMAKKTSLVRLG